MRAMTVCPATVVASSWDETIGRRRRLGTMVIATVVSAISFLGCSSGSSSNSGASRPSSTVHPAPVPACTAMTSSKRFSPPRDRRAVLAAAALLQITIDVDGTRPSTPRCVTGTVGGPPLRLHISDRVAFIANDPPRLSATDRRIVSVSSINAPPDTGPLKTQHVIVTVTAIGPGSVTLTYTNCSGTGC